MYIMTMKQLTKAEEQIMRVLWKIKKGFVRNILEELPQPKPAYNTVSTIVRILQTKEFVGHEAFGKTHQYYPLIDEDEYKEQYLKKFVKNYFKNSYKELVSFFAEEKNVGIDELEEIVKLIQKEIHKQKGG